MPDLRSTASAPCRAAGRIVSCSFGGSPLFSLFLYAEIGVKLVHVGLQVGIGEAIDDLAVLDDVVAVGHGGGEAEILLDQKDGEAFRLQPRDGVADLLDDDGSQSLGRLV